MNNKESDFREWALNYLGAAKTQLSLSTREERHLVRRDLQKGDLLAQCDILVVLNILVNHFPTIKTFLIMFCGQTVIQQQLDTVRIGNSVHVSYWVVLHPIHQSSRTVPDASRPQNIMGK
jgi:hypothetical protein